MYNQVGSGELRYDVFQQPLHQRGFGLKYGFLNEPLYQRGFGGPRYGFIKEPLRQSAYGLIRNGNGDQYGDGLFSLISRGFKMLSPVIKKGISIGKRVATSSPIKNVAKQVADSAIATAVDAVSDVIEGEDPKEKFSSNISNARKNIADTIRTELKRKNDTKDTSILKKRKKNKKKSNRNNKNSIL